MEPDLNLAIQHHEQGRFDEAARVYERILVQTPDDPSVLHLFGVLVHQRGDHQNGVDFIGRAIALAPHQAAFHANLAEVYRSMGQFDSARRCCQRALDLEPNFPGVFNNLGLLCQAVGQTDEAIAQFQRALEIRPDFALAHNNLGTVLRQAGQIEMALFHFEKAVEFDPTLSTAHSNLGQLRLERYQREPALHHCLEAVRLNPFFAEGHNNLGNVLRELGCLQDAKASYLEALRLNPELSMACNNLGQANQEEGNLDVALNWYRKGLIQDPNSARIHGNLASLYWEREQFVEATGHYQQAIELAPEFADAQHGWGTVLYQQGAFDEARKFYGEALRIRPDFAIAHCSLGTLFEEAGDLDLAENSFRQAIHHDPAHSGAYAQLATLLRGKLPESDGDTLSTLAANSSLSAGKRASLLFGLAQVDDAQGHYVPAAEELFQANSLAAVDRARRGLSYDPRQHDQFVQSLIEAFTPDDFQRLKAFGSTSIRPVFIIGLPRSGTTLTEQILASHPQVFGAGELGLAGKTFAALPELTHLNLPASACIKQLEGPLVADISRQFLEQLKKWNQPALRVIDKMPDNYLSVGLIATLFPDAKIIHCRRDLRDIAVSCWMTNFRQIHWANQFEHISGRFLAYQRLMDHWRRCFPGKILEIDYEETVVDLEGTARRLVNWVGLEWNPTCANFHEQRRPIRTASTTQVRQPIYGTSVARWKNYLPALAPLFEQLETVKPKL